MKQIFSLWLLISFATSSCAIENPASDSKPVKHDLWNTILQKHVTEKGMVNYAAIQKDSNQLNAYLTILEANHPNDKNWSKNEQLAYWINAYNAFTVRLIIRHYPIESIKDVVSLISIPLVNSPWDVKFIKIEHEVYDLNNLEHGIIRSQFNEPRIHFALVCAAMSCPKLLNEAYTSSNLEANLEAQAKNFINDKSKNNISSDKAQLSKLFSWYAGDFEKNGTLISYINRYSSVKLKETAKIDFMDYSWQLNKQ